jgi:5-methylcytosine-specific restriction endonuclease McrA
MTRSKARAARLIHYDEGRLCPRNHIPIRRLVSTGGCVVCQREHAARYYRLDPDKMVAKALKWARDNPDKFREKEARRDRSKDAPVKAAHRLRNLEKLREYMAEWQRNNPERRRANQAKRRARLRGSDGAYTPEDVAALLSVQGGRCAYCRKSVKRAFHVDHIMPLALGGSNVRANLQVLCASCNSKKGKRHPVEFAKTIGMLV